MRVTSQSELAVEVDVTGFAFVPSHLRGQTSYDAISSLGTVEKLSGINEIQELIPRNPSDSPPNIYSGNFGYSDFPFHTDLAHWFLPPHYFVLRCLEGASDVRTRLIDSAAIVQSLGEDSLRRALVKPRRPIEMSRPLLHILERCSVDKLRFRWDSLFIEPSTEHSTRVCSAIEEHLDTIKTIDFVLEQPGDTLVVDNWRILHGRSAVPTAQRNRRIHRAYLSILK